MNNLVSYRGNLVHKEALDALHKLDFAGKENQWSSLQISTFKTVPEKIPLDSPLYAGRQFNISVDAPVESLWSVAIPLGFMPWNRYPVNDDKSHIFHYYGMWAPIIDFLHSEGLGEWAWSSFICASLLEVGHWQGDKPVERKIQMHLHRLGIHCGPIDGIIGERTIRSLKNLGLSELRNSEILEKIKDWELTTTEPQNRNLGHLYFGGRKTQVICSGGVQSIQTNNGYTISINGKGKVVAFVE